MGDDRLMNCFELFFPRIKSPQGIKSRSGSIPPCQPPFLGEAALKCTGMNRLVLRYNGGTVSFISASNLIGDRYGIQTRALNF